MTRQEEFAQAGEAQSRDGDPGRGACLSWHGSLASPEVDTGRGARGRCDSGTGPSLPRPQSGHRQWGAWGWRSHRASSGGPGVDTGRGAEEAWGGSQVWVLATHSASQARVPTDHSGGLA